MIRQRTSNRRLWIALLAVMALFCSFQLERTTRNVHRSMSPPPGAIPVSSGEVPSSVQSQIISQLGGVDGESGDVALFPLAGGQVGAYMTVDLGYGIEPTGNHLGEIRRDINQWFESVYSKTPNPVVGDAEIFFLQNGRIIAGAGLGEAAYHGLDTAVNGGSSTNFVTMLQAGRRDANEGFNEAWVQLEP